MDADGDGDLDLIAANSPHAPYVSGVDYLSKLSDVLANAGVDAGAAFANVIPHQVTLRALQAGGSLDVTGGVWETSQATITSAAPIHAGGSTLATGTTLPVLGWLTQDLETAELDAEGSGGGQDLVVLQGVAQLVDALGSAGTPSSRPQRGAIVIRKQGGAGLGLGTAHYLDPGPMGIAPVHVAIADLTSGAHAGGFPNVGGPARSPPAGLPDLISVNGGDNSITIYVQTQASATPNDTPGEYHGEHLPLSPLVGVLLGNPAFALPAGDLRGVAIGDLNGDGANDFVVCGQLSRLALIFVYDPLSAGPLSLNNNTGGPYTGLTAGVLPFRLAGSITLPSIQVGRPAIGDVTGDGRNDIVFPQRFANEVAVYTNLGNDAAKPALGQSVTTPLFGPAGAAADSLPPNPTPVIFASAFQPFDARIRDFNDDGRDDLLVAAGLSFDLSAFYQTSAGTLDQLIPIPAGGAPFLLAVGDLTGDGVPEIAAALQNANEVRVFQRDVTTLLSTLKSYDVDGPAGVRNVAPYLVAPSFPFGIRIREVTQDGVLDLLASASIMVQGQAVTSSNVAQPLNTTAGWFYSTGGSQLGADIAVVRTSTIAPIAFSLDAGDVLGGDGIPDVVLSHNQGNGVVFYRGLGGGAFAGDPSGPNRIIPLAIGSGAEVLVVDLNGDGVYLDVIQASAFEATGLRVRYGSAGGPDPLVGDFVTIPTTGVGAPVAIQVVDVGGPLGPGGEALPDIVFTGFTVKSAGILFQNTRAVLANPPTFTGLKLTTGGEPSQIAIGDLNGDGLSDIAFPWGTENRLAVYYRNPAATSIANTFFGPATFPTANSPIGCVIVDVNGDGRNDVVVSARGASALNVFLQR
ncbi:MAG: VCBS repeat-containing protein [Planctomycetes bacterium]|nr:VCBS repeat-containing protein [Planctomycetota bacterium]